MPSAGFYGFYSPIKYHFHPMTSLEHFARGTRKGRNVCKLPIHFALFTFSTFAFAKGIENEATQCAANKRLLFVDTA
jgi:hypothetical protein